jgi:hypothetical protein
METKFTSMSMDGLQSAFIIYVNTLVIICIYSNDLYMYAYGD